MYVGVVCACMPGMRNFYTRVFPSQKLVEFTSSWKRSKVSQPTSSAYTIGSRGRRLDNFTRNRDIELSMATEDFEDPRLWQQEFETARAESRFGLEPIDLSSNSTRAQSVF